MNWRGWWLGVLALAGFVWLNTWNRCQPGWCGRYGVPFTFYQWSDEIPEVNGVTNWPRVRYPALAVDAVVAIGASTFIAAAASRLIPVKHGAA
jgi:hypothetical protein